MSGTATSEPAGAAEGAAPGTTGPVPLPTPEQVDITADEALHRAYFERIPVVALDGEELCEYFVDEALLRERLESGR